MTTVIRVCVVLTAAAFVALLLDLTIAYAWVCHFHDGPEFPF